MRVGYADPPYPDQGDPVCWGRVADITPGASSCRAGCDEGRVPLLRWRDDG